MKRRSLTPTILCAVIVLTSSTLLLPVEPTRAAKAYVLDPGAPSVSAVDVAAGQIITAAPLKGQPSEMLLTKDRSKLVVLDPGPRKLTVRYGFHPTGKSSITIIDTESFQVTARQEIGWNLEGAWLSPDESKLVGYCHGYQSQKPSETLPWEIVVVDMRTGLVSGRVGLPRRADQVWLAADGHTAVAYSANEIPKNQRPIPAELRLIDIEGASSIETFTLEKPPRWVAMSPDGNFVYLLEPGQPSNNAEKNVNGRLVVLSVADRALVGISDAGSKPQGLFLDGVGQQMFLLSDGTPTKERPVPDGELRVVRGPEIAATLKIARAPQFVRMSSDRGRLYVVSHNQLTAVDMGTLQTLWKIPLSQAGGSVVSSGIVGAAFESHPVTDLALTRDGKRAFALYGQSSKLVLLDLEASKQVAAVTTGRGGIKFAKFLGSIAATAASAYAGYSVASATGSPYYTYAAYGVSPASTAIAVRPDGKFGYVLNTQTNDVTIVDSTTGAVIEKIAAGGYRLQTMTGGDVITTVAGNILRPIDTRTQKALPEIPLGGILLDFSLSPDGRFATALVDRAVLCLDGSTCKVIKRTTGFKRPTQILFEEGEQPAPPISPQTQPAPQTQPEETPVAEPAAGVL